LITGGGQLPKFPPHTAVFVSGFMSVSSFFAKSMGFAFLSLVDLGAAWSDLHLRRTLSKPWSVFFRISLQIARLRLCFAGESRRLLTTSCMHENGLGPFEGGS
jgi:hypothetical protein